MAEREDEPDDLRAEHDAEQRRAAASVPPPKSPAPQASAEMSPSRMTDEPAPRTSARSDGLRLDVVVDGGRALEHDHRVGERVVAVRGRQVDDLEVAPTTSRSSSSARGRSLVVERHERVVEDERRPPVAGHEPDEARAARRGRRCRACPGDSSLTGTQSLRSGENTSMPRFVSSIRTRL